MNFEEIFGTDYTTAIQDLDWSANTLVRLIDFLQSMILDGCFAIYNKLFAIVETISDISNEIPNADAIFDFTADVASILLIILFLKKVFTNYVLDLDGEADYDVLQSITNICVALAVINCGGEIHELLMKVSELLRSGMSEKIASSITDQDLEIYDAMKNTISRLGLSWGTKVSSAVTPGGIGTAFMLLSSLWGIVVIILLIILLGKLMFRGVELFFFRVLLPIFASDIISGKKELWSQFSQEYLKTIFGYLLQRLALDMAVALVFEIGTVSSEPLESLWYPFLSTMLLYFAIKTPKWLQKFTYSSGVGQTVSSAGRSAVGTGSSIFMMSRFIR